MGRKLVSEENMQMAKNYMKKVLNITNHQGNANQNHSEISPGTCQNNLSKRKEISAGEDVEKTQLSCTVCRKVNWCIHYGKQYGASSKILKNRTTIRSSDSISGSLSKENENTN